jgi:hypothetical protein
MDTEATPAQSVPDEVVEASTKVEAAKADEVVKGDEARVPPPVSTSAIPDAPRVDVSAATVARMMGIASTSDLRVLEGRIDLLTSKVAAILTKVDRCLSMFSSVPSASDVGRLEVQLASIKSMMREVLDVVGTEIGPLREQSDREAAQEQSRKLREGIKSSSES